MTQAACVGLCLSPKLSLTSKENAVFVLGPCHIKGIPRTGIWRKASCSEPNERLKITPSNFSDLLLRMLSFLQLGPPL